MPDRSEAREALFYSAEDGALRCALCPHACRIAPGQTGLCHARRNENGVLRTRNYGQCTALALDPVEKKPLYHFYPGRKILSVGSWGCNFRCAFCQNWEISQGWEVAAQYLSPEALQDAAQGAGAETIGVAFTYAEPSVWYEYVLETAQLIKAAGFKTVLVTNGFLSLPALKHLLPWIDAWNIDVKAFDEAFYRKLCGGALCDVLTVEQVASRAHLEVTTLVLPDLNDSEMEIDALARWLASLDANIPLHLSRYFPRYKLQLPPTPVERLRRLYEVARTHLSYVYLGNVTGAENNTVCPRCSAVVIDRSRGETRLLADGSCAFCGERIASGEVAPR